MDLMFFCVYIVGGVFYMFKRIMTILIILSSCNLEVSAYNPPDPYEVTQIITESRIAREECLIIMQESMKEYNEEDYNEEWFNSSLSEMETLMAQIQGEYEAINLQINQLEWGESDSLQWATIQLNYVVEQVYNDYWNNDDNFSYLSEEEQLAIISIHEVVISWQNYSNEVQQMINQLIADQSELEVYYSNLNYQYNELLRQEQGQQEMSAQVNQCRLYAYSGEDLKVDQILLNNQHGINDYLVQIDGYLSKIVPKAYRTVAFSDIQRLFAKQLSSDYLDQILSNKANIVLDSYALESYSYEKELSLVDIENLAHYAQRAYQKDNDLSKYNEAYNETIELKESQWQYIYQTNPKAFEFIKENLASYLNDNNQINEESIEQVRSLHQRYQSKLVLFDDNSQSWFPANAMESGYFAEFNLDLKLDNGDINDELGDNDSNWSSSSNSLESEESIQLDLNSDDETHNHLESLKNHLSESRTPTDIKSLPKPSIDKLAESQEAANKEREQKLSNISLPSTGEKLTLTIIAVIILTIGILIVSYNLWIKYRRKREIKEINLD